MIWDGIGFFQTERHKLPRHYGEEVTFKSRFKHKSSIVFIILMVVFIAYILGRQLNTMGAQKAQNLSLVK